MKKLLALLLALTMLTSLSACGAKAEKEASISVLDIAAPQQAQTSEEPAQASEQEAEPSAAPGEPSSQGDGQIGMEQLLRLYKWMDTMDGSLLFAKTYEEIASAAGAEGFDCGNTGPNSVSPVGDHYFNWYADDTHYLHVGFRARDDGSWTVCGLNTSNISRDDYADADISALAPKADNGPASGVELTLKDFYEHHCWTISAELPQANWYPQLARYTIYFYNAASEDSINSGSARIQFELKDTVEDFDFYRDSFQNLQELPSRTIGGIEMTGRSYDYVGMPWIEYLGATEENGVISIKVSGVDLSEGSEGAAVLDSISFAW